LGDDVGVTLGYGGVQRVGGSYEKDGQAKESWQRVASAAHDRAGNWGGFDGGGCPMHVSSPDCEIELAEQGWFFVWLKIAFCLHWITRCREKNGVIGGKAKFARNAKLSSLRSDSDERSAETKLPSCARPGGWGHPPLRGLW
jgi:hypothetical protein